MKILKFCLLAVFLASGASASDKVFKDANHAYKSICGHCHKDGGVGPDTVRMEFPAEVQNDRIAQIEQIVRHGQKAMPPFRKTEIDDATLRELATLLAQGKIK